MRELDAFLQQATTCGTVPGAVVCVAHRGQVVWHQAYGAAALTPQYHPMQRDTLFDIASLTKVIATTSLVLLAHHEGVCHLDEALQRFYPQTRGIPLGATTVRQVLAHTGGLAAWRPLYQALPPATASAVSGRPFLVGPTRPSLTGRFPAGPMCQQASSPAARRHQTIQKILQEPCAYRPGSQVLYSDLGFMLLGDIVETHYQQPLDRLFHERVAQPLGLHCTGYRPLDGPCGATVSAQGAALPLPESPTAYAATEACPWRARVLQGEVHDENAWAMGGVAGHAGLFATAEDLWRFAHAVLETAAGRRDWLPATLLQKSWQRHATPPGTTRALGWDTPTPGRSSSGDYFSERSIGHLGFTGCSLWIDLAQQVTVVLCTNRVHPTRHAPGITRLRPAVHNLIMRALGVATT